MHVCDTVTDLLHVLPPVYMPFMIYTVPTHEAALRGCQTELPPTRQHSLVSHQPYAHHTCTCSPAGGLWPGRP